jgi:uncharacterized membrane protein
MMSNSLKAGYRSSGTPDRYTWLLVLVLLAGLVLRLTGLTVQSLWIDELHTMHESSPKHTLKQIIYFLQTGIHDPHPPLHFLLIHYWFKVVGHTDFSARLLSALGGTLSIFTMYLLGKELFNRNVGLIAAVLTAFNYANLYYSQEARNYIFSFVFTCLSFYCLVRALREPSVKRNLWYGVATLVLLYTHYYGFAILGAQMVIILVALLQDLRNFKKHFLRFLLSGAVVLVGYSPWIGTVLSMGKMPSFWIPRPTSDFFVSYFTEYFGYQYILIYLYAILLLVFLLNVFRRGPAGPAAEPATAQPAWHSDRLLFSFVILMTWIIVSYLRRTYGRFTQSTRPCCLAVYHRDAAAHLLAIAWALNSCRAGCSSSTWFLFSILIRSSIVSQPKIYTRLQAAVSEKPPPRGRDGAEFPIITDQETLLPGTT